MSGNWDVCPKCWDVAMDEFRKKHADVMALYGTVPVNEFDAARDALEPPVKQDFRTFREDYEIYGAETGLLQVSYRGNCKRCGIVLKFEFDKQLWPEAS
jgi:hypothetical protein